MGSILFNLKKETDLLFKYLDDVLMIVKANNDTIKRYKLMFFNGI